MSTFAKKSFGANLYSKLRPYYPAQFYEALAKYAGPVEAAVDIGCGTGQATKEIAAFADNVVGVDNSQPMIDQANESEASAKVSFKKANDETFVDLFEPASLDLIAVAEAAHWFDLPVFYKNAAKLLKPNGTLAIWCYCDSVIQDYPDTTGILLKYTYGEDFLGPYWEPGRKVLGNFLGDYPLPPALFKDVVKVVNMGDQLKRGSPLEIVKKTTLKDYLSYYRTFSAFHNWKEAHPDIAEGDDLVSKLLQELTQISPLKEDSEITVKWNTMYTFGRRI